MPEYHEYITHYLFLLWFLQYCQQKGLDLHVLGFWTDKTAGKNVKKPKTTDVVFRLDHNSKDKQGNAGNQGYLWPPMWQKSSENPMMCWHIAGHVLNKTNTGTRCCINACKCCDQVSDGPQHVHRLHKWEIGYEMKWGELRQCLQSQKLRMSTRARTQMRTQMKRSQKQGGKLPVFHFHSVQTIWDGITKAKG